MARSSMADLITRLRSLVGDPAGAATVYSAWQASHAYVIGDTRRPTVANGHSYRVSVAGTSAASEPTFPTGGGTVIDGTTVWVDQGAIPSGTATFTDDELQDFLDERRTDVIEARLRTRPTIGGLFVDYFAPRAWWEDGVVLATGAGVVLTADSDSVSGRGHVWVFTSGQTPDVYITGSYYDIYGTASAVCNAWAAKVAREFDFATDQQTFDRTGKRVGLLAVAAEFARKAIQPGVRPAWRSSDW